MHLDVMGWMVYIWVVVFSMGGVWCVSVLMRQWSVAGRGRGHNGYVFNCPLRTIGSDVKCSCLLSIILLLLHAGVTELSLTFQQIEKKMKVVGVVER